MNWKFTTIIFITGLLTFALGWFSHDMKQFADGVVADGKQIDSLQKVKPKSAIITQDQLDSLMISSNTNDKSENFPTKLSGRFVLKGAQFAGFNFYSPTRITWTNEMDAGHPDTLKIRWLNNSTFYTQNTLRLYENCPPRIQIYQVISFDGQHLILKDIWTGWNEHSDERHEFIKNDKMDD